MDRVTGHQATAAERRHHGDKPKPVRTDGLMKTSPVAEERGGVVASATYETKRGHQVEQKSEDLCAQGAHDSEKHAVENAPCLIVHAGRPPYSAEPVTPVESRDRARCHAIFRTNPAGIKSNAVKGSPRGRGSCSLSQCLMPIRFWQQRRL